MNELFKNCDNSKQLGNIGHLLAMSYYASLGWNISNPITDSNEYDFIAEDKQGKLLKIQVKTSRFLSNSGNYIVNLTTSGGNQRKYWSKELNTESLDYLFVVTNEGDCYSIPVNVLDSKNSLTLYKKYSIYKVMTINTNIEFTEEIKNNKEYFCSKCGEKVSKAGVLCKKCSAIEIGKDHRKVERPDKETLLNQLSTSNMTKVGEYYGVSDNAVRKWLKSYNLPTSIKILRNEGLI